MSIAVYIVAYLSVIVFFGAVIARIVAYLRKPIHVRWELYPVAHDVHAEHGGSYLEEVDWWKKEPEKSLAGELAVMVPEILLLKAVWEHNRKLWWVSYPFHLGLYLLTGFLGLQALGAIWHLAGTPVSSDAGGLAGVLGQVIHWLGPAGFALTAFGAVGLLVKRMTDADLRLYSSGGHYFNLLLILATVGLGAAAWYRVDPDFASGRVLLANLFSFHLTEVGDGLFAAAALLTCFTIAYIPLTHMSHFFMKYFLYHDIRWGDEPNVHHPETDAKIATVLNYPVSWAAAHIAGDGKKTWAEVATFNPMRPDGKEPQ